MVKTLTRKFKVETIWPELINKRVQQIDSHLKEIQFFNQGGSLLAKGSLKRQVKYIDSGGKIRKTEDKLQFEVIIGPALSEPLPYLTPELKSDYFIFQPRRLGENHALLEQGFTLVIKELEITAGAASPFTILTDQIISKGKGENFYSFQTNLKRDSRPKKFNGKLVFERSKPPVVTGTITGVIVYRNSHQILKEQEVSHSFSFLIDSVPKETEGELIINGTIIEVDWILPSGGQGWMAELKFDYCWSLSTRKELIVLGWTERDGHSNPRIRANLLIKEERLQFPKSIRIENDQMGPFEVEPEIKLLDWRRIGSGLLINAKLNYDLFLPDATGMEKYRSVFFETEELVEGFFDNIDDHDLTLILEPKLTIGKRTYNGTSFLIDNILGLTAKLYQPRVICLAQENNLTEISGLTPLSEKKLPLLSEAMLNLGHPPRRIIQVRNRLLQTNPSIKKGWFNLSGVMEVAVIYHDHYNQYREEYFRLIFQKSYCWEGINDTDEYQIDLDSKLEYDSYQLESNQLLYKYLWGFSASIFHKQCLKVAVSSVNASIPKLEASQLPLQQSVQELTIQGEVPLKFGNPREIAVGRGIITEFNWRNALNAVFVEGKIKGEIEYWDEDGFLRREIVDFSFWRFLTKAKLIEEDAVLVPTLRRFNYYPLRPWPWLKGTVRYEVHIEINI